VRREYISCPLHRTAGRNAANSIQA